MDVPSQVVYRYLLHRKSEIECCLKCLLQKDYEALLRIGHMLKGNGATFGFPDLSKLGEKLEEAAISENHREMETTLQEISRLINLRLNSNSFL